MTDAKILIVDDDSNTRFIMNRWLSRQGGYNNIIEAAGVAEAVRTLQSADNFDLIFSDIFMPDCDGLEGIKKIRELPAYQKTPIVALLSADMPKLHIQVLEAGANYFLIKPFRLELLLEVVEAFLSINREQTSK